MSEMATSDDNDISWWVSYILNAATTAVLSDNDPGMADEVHRQRQAVNMVEDLVVNHADRLDEFAMPGDCAECDLASLRDGQTDHPTDTAMVTTLELACQAYDRGLENGYDMPFLSHAIDVVAEFWHRHRGEICDAIAVVDIGSDGVEASPG